MSPSSVTDPPAEPAPGAPPSQPAPALGQTVLRGSFWMAANSAATKLAGLAAQVALAWWLTGHDFGIYAIALSLATFTMLLRDGGVRQLLIHRQDDYERLVGPVFWMAGSFNLAAGLLVAALAPLAAAAYQQPVLLWMLLVMALALPLGTPAAILTARLSIDMRFREVAIVQGVSALIRYGGSVALALAGMGPLSFILPLPVVACAEWVLARAFCRERLWSRPARPGIWRGLFAQTKWVLLAAFAISLWNIGSYAAIGLVVEERIVGLYYWSFQLVAQTGLLVSLNLNQVLFPAFVKILAEPERLAQAMRRSLRHLMLIAAPLSLVLVPAFGPLELLVWGGRWSEAVPSVQIVALLYPLTLVQCIPFAALQAWGSFRRVFWMYLALSAGLMASGILWAVLVGTPHGIALGSMIFMVAGTLWMARASLRRAGVGLRDVLAGTLPAWAASVAAAALALWLDRAWLAGAPAVSRFLVACSVFGVAYAGLLRLTMAEHLREAIGMAPSRLRPLAHRAFGL